MAGTLIIYIGKRSIRCSCCMHQEYPTGRFAISELQNPAISEFYAIEKC